MLISKYERTVTVDTDIKKHELYLQKIRNRVYPTDLCDKHPPSSIQLKTGPNLTIFGYELIV